MFPQRSIILELKYLSQRVKYIWSRIRSETVRVDMVQDLDPASDPDSGPPLNFE